jgi:hypothetical protein
MVKIKTKSILLFKCKSNFLSSVIKKSVYPVAINRQGKNGGKTQINSQGKNGGKTQINSQGKNGGKTQINSQGKNGGKTQ